MNYEDFKQARAKRLKKAGVILREYKPVFPEDNDQALANWKPSWHIANPEESRRMYEYGDKGAFTKPKDQE